MYRALIALIASATLFTPMATLAQAIPPMPRYIAPEHQTVLQSWLEKHKGFRVATDEDCECNDDIASTRRGSGGDWVPNPNFHPYYAVGDFNSDSQPDFAVILITVSGKKHLAIFNGPFSTKTVTLPAYLGNKYVGDTGALFFGAPRPKPWRLIVGEFETEGTLFKPHGASYVALQSD